MTAVVTSIVEGHGEVQALPVLIRRVAEERGLAVEAQQPFRMKRNHMSDPVELRRSARTVLLRAGEPAALLVLLDADDDCAVTLAGTILRSLGDVGAVAVAVAVHEFENWFVAGAGSLSGVRGLADDLGAVPDPEGIRGAKEWLMARSRSTSRYRPTVDQAALTARFDMEAAMAARSFRKCRKEIDRLLDAVAGTG